MAVRDVRINYGYDVDQASVRSAVRATEQIAQATGATAENIEQVNQELNRELGIIEKLRKKELELEQARNRSNDPDEIQAYNRELRNTRNEVNRLTESTEQQEKKTSKLASGFKKLGGIIAGAFSVAAIGSFIKGGVDLAAQMEQLEINFAQFTGSGQAARAMLGDIEAFAASTPFQFPELANTAKKLLAFGVAQDEILPKLRQIGDVAAGSGNSVEELGAIFGKIITKGKAQTEELNQLAERGIPIYQILAEQFGKTTAQIGKMAEGGELSADVIEDAFTKMTSAGGKFFGLTQKQSESTAGRISTLKDNFEKLQRELGQKLLPIVNDVVGAFTGFIQEIGFGSGSVDVLTEKIFEGSRALQEQQTELNILVPLLKDTTLAEEARAKVLDQIANINPEILKGLDLQNIEYDKLDENLDKVNKELTEQIKLLRQKETIDFISAKNAEARNKQIETELFLGALIRKNFKDQELLSKSTGEQIEILTKRFEENGGQLLSSSALQTIFLEAANKRNEAIKQQKTLTEFLTRAQVDLNQATSEGKDKTEEATESTDKAGKSIKQLKNELKELKESYELAGSDDERSAIAKKIKALQKLVKGYDITTKKTKEAKKELFNFFKQVDEGLDRKREGLDFLLPDSEDYRTDLESLLQEVPPVAEGVGLTFAEKIKEGLSSLTPEDFAEVAGLAIGIISDLQEAQFNRRLSLLEEEKQQALSNANLTAEGRTAIEENFQAKREKLELEAARKRKAIAIVEATIEGAIAVIKTLANPILAAIVAASVAANIALIASQQFKKGGSVPDGFTGHLHPDQPAGVVHGGEFVIDAPTTKALGLRGKTMRDFKNEFLPMVMKQDWAFNQVSTGMSPEFMTEIKGLRKDLKRLPVNVTVLDENGFTKFVGTQGTWQHILNNNLYG